MAKPLNTSLAFVPGLGFHATVWEQVACQCPHSQLLSLPKINPMTDMAQIAAQLLTQIRQPTWLVGWSLGGLVAWHMAHQAPDQIAGVISVGTNVAFTATAKRPGINQRQAQRFYRLMQKDAKQALKELCDVSLAPHSHHPHRAYLSRHVCWGQAWQASWLRYLSLLYAADASALLKTLKMPTVGIVGEHDIFFSTEAVTLCIQNNMLTRLINVTDGSHALFVTHLNHFMALLRQSLERFCASN